MRSLVGPSQPRRRTLKNRWPHWQATRSKGAPFVPAATKIDLSHKDRGHTKTRVFKWAALTALVLLVLAVVGLMVVNRQLPALIERQLNAHVEGYRFTVGEATLSPSLSLEIQQLTMIQMDHPDPPVAEIPRWVLSIQWSQIFSGVLVSDYLVSRPILHITLPQAQQELQEEVPIQEKGWREAVYSFYPIKINEFKIEDADVTYVDQDASKPLHFTHLNLLAGNIRNVRSPNDTYPSDLTLDGTHLWVWTDWDAGSCEFPCRATRGHQS